MRSENGEGIEMVHTDSLRTEEMIRLRALCSIFATLSYLQGEPLCGQCSAFVKVFETAMEKFLLIEKGMGQGKSMPESTRKMFHYIYNVLSELRVPDNPVKQKKVGHCGFPPGVCLAKNAGAVYERVDGET